MVTVSAEGETRFESAYGPKSAPCVLLYFPDHKEVIALFITNDKEHLIYDVNVNLDRYMVLKKESIRKVDKN